MSHLEDSQASGEEDLPSDSPDQWSSRSRRRRSEVPPAPRRARGEELSLLSRFQYFGTAREKRGREEKAMSQGMNERGGGGERTFPSLCVLMLDDST